jgi:lipopolysaccharide biosynthesis glycosyltransferase
MNWMKLTDRVVDISHQDSTVETPRRLIVATACDRAYLYPWAVSLVSAAKFSDRPFDAWFGLAADWKNRLSTAELDHVLALMETVGKTVAAVEVNLETTDLQASSYISPTAFVKLGLFDLCPTNATMVWLDADLVVRRPWMQMLKDSKGYPISGHHELNPVFESRWSEGKSDWYTNTGVVIVNGDGWQDEFAERWKTYLEKYAINGFKYMDQDVLNALVTDRWNPLSGHYNYRPIHEKSWSEPAVVHFSGRYKPWMCTSLQDRLLRGVWRPSFDAFFEAETLFEIHIEKMLSDQERRYWVSERRRTRGRFGGKAWKRYGEVLAQGAFKLN